jgi:hypothetical protein
VKLLRSTDAGFVFQFARRERRLLLGVLELYPLIPASYHRLSKTADPEQIAADQKLLDEALAAQKAENQRQLLAVLNGPGRFKLEADGYDLTLSAEQVDCFLQVLNDVRVGSWLKLGCPDPGKERPAEPTEDNVHYYVAMEFCGVVQSLLLQALDTPA